MAIFKSYKQFLAEGEDNWEIAKKDNPELEDQVENDTEEKSSECPRCGGFLGSCDCQEKDYQSTINIYRMKPGEKIDNKKQ